MGTQILEAIEVFKTNGGILTSTSAFASGMHPRTLYAMRDSGIIEPLARGVFRLSNMSPMTNPDLATVAMRIPRGVICLISALAFHDLTTQVPHEVHLALPRSARYPRLAYPRLHVYHFSKNPFNAGIEEHSLDGVNVRIYNPEKTIADCFKYRGKIGMDIVLEAIKLYRNNMRNFSRIMEYAKICRVERQIRPYLEIMI